VITVATVNKRSGQSYKVNIDCKIKKLILLPCSHFEPGGNNRNKIKRRYSYTIVVLHAISSQQWHSGASDKKTPTMAT